MKIPIFNSIFIKKEFFESDNLNFEILNNLDFRAVDYKKFPLVKILKDLPDNTSLFETILVSINDKLVESFLKID